jgi:type III secretion system FlhB-like substrate exporter
MAKITKSPYEIYQTQNLATLNDALYSKILEKALKFNVAMFQNPDLAKDLCDISLVPARLSADSSQKVIDNVVWLLESRNNAQLSKD